MFNLKDKQIAVDSMIIIYLLEKDPRYWKIISDILANAHRIIFSTLVLGEVLAGFYETNNLPEANNFMNFVKTRSNIYIQDFDTQTAIEFAKLRSQTKISAPDCIHLASALTAHAEVFLTNDKRIKSVDNVSVMFLDDIAKTSS